MSRFTAAVRRFFLGPTDQEISDRSLAAGGTPYPIPSLTVQPPTDLTLGPVAELLAACPHGRTARCGRCQAEAMGAIGDAMRKADPAGFLTAARHATEQTRRAMSQPTVTLGDPMPDATDTNPITVTPETDPAANPVTDSGVHALEGDDYVQPTIRVSCPTCGVGHVDRPVNALLRESVGLIPVDGGDMVIKEFYTRLLRAAPTLGSLFPRDLLTAATQDGASPGAMQRDKLLNAIAGLAELYGSSRADMDHLTTLLLQWGRSHAAFARPDGTVRGAAQAEYELVGTIFIRTFADVAGDQWKPEYERAWAEAYDDAVLVMRWAQRQSSMTAARYPRRDASRD